MGNDTKWEYEFPYYNPKNGECIRDSNGKVKYFLMDMLTLLGYEGWELVSIIESPIPIGEFTHMLILKRLSDYFSVESQKDELMDEWR